MQKKCFTWHTLTFLLTETTHMLYRSEKKMPSKERSQEHPKLVNSANIIMKCFPLVL